MTAIWQAGTTYVPGAIVRPTSIPAPGLSPITNPGFETGDLTGWTVSGPAIWAVQNGSAFAGTYDVNAVGGGISALKSNTIAAVLPGQTISAQGMANLTNAGVDDLSAELALYWLTSGGVFISQVQGATLSGVGGSWNQITVSGVAPSNAAQVQLVLGVNTGSHGGNVRFDQLTWQSSYTGPPAGLVYKATQAAPGKSGTGEPAWPGNTTTSVTDNQVTWQGIIATQLVWTASPVNISGGTQPTWPTSPGGSVNDNGIVWIAQTAQITDVNCPQSKIVVIAAGKVYAADNDIIRYSATVNPLDWTAANDAGYLPFGLQTYGSNPVAAMNIYRSNLVPFNAEGFQMWQVDPDPANTTLLDALPVASSYNKALAPVANDLLFLSSQGVRSIGIAASSTNLQAGDVGMPIDPLVKAAMATVPATDEPRATYLPALGQFWISFNAANRLSCTVFVYTINQIGQVGKWSRYVFPFPIDNFTMQADLLYIRSNNDILMYDNAALVDYNNDPTVPTRATPFTGIVQWPWLDFGNPGVSKMLIGFDLVGSAGSPSVSVGYDQSNFGTFTPDFIVPEDTVSGAVIPLPVLGPSFSFRITYAGGQKWQLQAINVYLQDARITA